MLAHERQQQILQMMQQTHSIRISQIAERFSVSNETARRDLEYLQRKGFLRRVHGGANLLRPATALEALAAPEETGDDAAEDAAEQEPLLRAALARAAADLVEDNDILFIGHGMTMHQLSRVARERQNLTVLTNSIRVINELIDCPVTLYALGGLIDRDEQNMGGSIPVSVIQQFYATKAFISCGGVSPAGEVSDYHSDGTLQQLMLQHADRRFLIADSSKFGRNAFCRVCELSTFDVIISDAQLPPEYRDLIAQLGIELRLVDIP